VAALARKVMELNLLVAQVVPVVVEQPAHPLAA
jgi:hypothetical protein